jgi:hypothetical protein
MSSTKVGLAGASRPSGASSTEAVDDELSDMTSMEVSYEDNVLGQTDSEHNKHEPNTRNDHGHDEERIDPDDIDDNGGHGDDLSIYAHSYYPNMSFVDAPIDVGVEEDSDAYVFLPVLHAMKGDIE